MQYCTSCGAPLTAEDNVCPACSAVQVSPTATPLEATLKELPAYGSYVATAPAPTLLTAPPVAPSQLLRRRRLSRRLISLAFFVILGASVGYITHSNANHAAKTAQLYQQATATAVVLDATAQAADHIYTTVTNTTPTLLDSLENAQGSQWKDEVSKAGSSCTFMNGSYYVKEVSTHLFLPCYEQQSFSNFVFQVQMTIVQGDDGVVLFRASKSNGKFYLMRIDQSGQYAVDMYPDNTGKTAKVLARTASNWIKTGYNQLNLVGIVVRNNIFSLFINRHYVTDIIDGASTYTQGIIALGAEDITSGGTTVMYNNVQIWSL